MHDLGLRNVGTVLQSRLFRTEKDVEDICNQLGSLADFRICKGIYLESAEIAHTSYQAIVDAFNQRVDQMLDSGAYTAIASHDIPVIKHALNSLEKRAVEIINKINICFMLII